MYSGKHSCDVKRMTPDEREYKLGLLVRRKQDEAAAQRAAAPKKKKG